MKKVDKVLRSEIECKEFMLGFFRDIISYFLEASNINECMKERDWKLPASYPCLATITTRSMRASNDKSYDVDFLCYSYPDELEKEIEWRQKELNKILDIY